MRTHFLTVATAIPLALLLGVLSPANGQSTGELLKLKVIPSDQTQAMRLLTKHDLNDSGSLDSDELIQLSWATDVPKFDLDGDGKLTTLEVALWFAHRRSESGVERIDQLGANKFLARYDRNGDRELDAEEMKRGNWPLTPKGFDADGNGRLTAFEIAAEFAVRRKKRKEGGIEAGDQNYAISTLNSFDQNGDRGIDEAELETLKGRLVNFSIDFGEADKNKDGKLGIAELALCFSGKRTSRGVTPADQREANTLMVRFDRNQNGQLDAAEIDNLEGTVPYDLKSFDADKNGSLTKTELEDGIVKHKRALGVENDDLKVAARLILRYDKNRDSHIGVQEVESQSTGDGDAMTQLNILALVDFDQDFDQQLSLAEAAQYVASKRKAKAASAKEK